MLIQRSRRVDWLMVLILVFGFSVESRALGLWEAYQLALDSDPAYQRQLNLYNADRQRVPQARADLLPKLDVSLGHTRGYLEIDGREDAFAGNGRSTSREAGDVSLSSFNLEPEPVPREDDFHNTRASLTLSQTVFDRSRWLAVDSAQSQTGEARLELGTARESLVLDTVEAYFDLLSARDALEAAKQELQAVERQLQLTERRYEAEIGTLTDVHESRARRELARIDIINARNNEALARHRLGKFTNTSIGNVNRLPESFDPPPLRHADTSYWVDQALENSVSVQLSRQRARTAELELKRQASGHWPTVSLVGESAYQEAGLSSVSTGEDRFRNQVSLQLRVPIFAGLAVRSRVKEAQFRKFAADQGVMNARAEVSRDIRSAYDSVQSSRRRAATYKLAYEQSLLALELRRKGYLEGLSSNLDLLDAFRDAFRSRRQWLQSRYQYLIDYLTLYILSRTVDDDVIRRIDSFLNTEAE